MRKSIYFYIFARYVTVAVGVGINIILSRILSPSDFGIVAGVTAFTAIFGIFSSMGLGTGIVQNKSITKKDINNIFSFSLYFSILLWALFWILAKPVANFYKDIRYENVIKLLSISVFFNSLNVVPDAAIMRDERFGVISKRMLVSSCVSGVVAIIVAVIGGKYFSLILQTILSATIQFFWNICDQKLCVYTKPNISSIKKIWSYSIYQFLYTLILSFSQNLDNLLTGRLMGAEKLAYYNKSYTLMRYPINYIPHIITPIMHPILSNYQKDLDLIYHRYIQIAKTMSLIGIYLSLVCFWNASEIIVLLFGNKWSPAGTPFMIFSLGIWIQLIGALAGSVYMSSNNTKNMFFSGIIHVTITLFAITIGISRRNINILACLLTISWWIKFFDETFFLIKQSLHKSIIKYFRFFLPECGIFLLISIIMFVLNNQILMCGIVKIIVNVPLITVLYCILCICFGQEKYIRLILPVKRKE